MRANGNATTGLCLWVALGAAVGACGSDDKDGLADVVAGNETAGDVTDLDGILADTADSNATDTEAPEVEVVDTYVPQPGEFGYGCTANDECHSGWCIQTADGRQCTRTCSSECPDGYDCREAPGTDAVFVCLPRYLHLCEPCRETVECNEVGETGNYCISRGEDGRFCGVGCLGGTCPEGYACEAVEVGGGTTALQCVPANGEACECSTYATQLQKPTTCFVENVNGKCEGTRFCIQSGLSSCDAATPFPESCNQLDDNCNGQTDEFPPDYVCQITNEFGHCPGKGTCTDGNEACVGTAPAPDLCDGIDNDCNGETDDGECDDLNPCTTDSCDPNSGKCLHANDNTKLCDDGSVCTQMDKCQDGTCKGFNPLPCGNANPCETWQCDPTIGCLSEFNTASCEDGNPCTVNDKCNQGVCVSGGPNPCNDHNECTTDACVAGTGCTHNGLVNGTGCQMAGLGQCQRSECQNSTCVPKPITSGPGSCAIGSGECSAGHCAAGTCQHDSGGNCGPVEACPPCLDAISCFICPPELNGKCNAGGECIPDFTGVTCSASCPQGQLKICGVCIPYQ